MSRARGTTTPTWFGEQRRWERVAKAMRLGMSGGGALVACVALAGVSSVAVLLRGNVGEAAPVTFSQQAAPAGAARPDGGGRGRALATPSGAAPGAGPAVDPPTTTTMPPTTTTTAPPPPPSTPAALPPGTPPVDPAALPALSWGDSGNEVALLQQRLNDLGFRDADTPGDFSAGTFSAVLAFQKFEGLDRTGDVDTAFWQHLYSPQGWMPPPRPAGPPRVEVDLERQVLFVFNAERPAQVTILNTSTGGEYYYTNKDGSTDYAYTPEGDFRVYRRYDGTEVAPLGTLYRPLYFTGGWAVHGSPSVPAYPASHGCVRLSDDDQDWLWDRAPDDMEVTVRATTNPQVLAQQAWEAWVQELAESGTVAPL